MAWGRGNLFEAAENIYDGWYADKPIDWHDFIARLEARTNINLGDDMDSPTIQAVQRHIRKYRRKAETMARSMYVYVVLNGEGVPYAAFTVKHELVTYLRRLSPDVDLMASVVRLPDGGERGRNIKLDIKELLA